MKKVFLVIYLIGRFSLLSKPSFSAIFSGTGIIPKYSFVAMQVDKISGIGKDGEILTSAAISTILSGLYVS